MTKCQMIEDNCPITPVGHKIVLHFPLQEKIGSIIVSTRSESESVIGTVVGIGPDAWVDFGKEPWCKLGDRVIVKKWSGTSEYWKDQLYRIVDDREIWGPRRFPDEEYTKPVDQVGTATDKYLMEKLGRY